MPARAAAGVAGRAASAAVSATIPILRHMPSSRLAATMTDDRVREARRVVENYVEPHLGMPLGDAKAVKSVRLEGGTAVVEVELGFPAGRYGPELAAALERRAGGPARASAPPGWMSRWPVAAQAVQGGLQPLPGIRNVIAVASGKGGVGKSTIAVNLALAWRSTGARVGLLDADIYGPSQPRMMGLQGERPGEPRRQAASSRSRRTASRSMSIGFLIEEEQPMVWRGPMVTQALTQLLGDTELGRARLPRRRHAARHRRHPADARAARAGQRRGHRHHAAGHRAARRAQGPADVREGRRSRCSASSRT